MSPERGEPSGEDVFSAIQQSHNAAFDLIQQHPHQWGSETCEVCRQVSSLIQKPFGCVLHLKKKMRGE